MFLNEILDIAIEKNLIQNSPTLSTQNQQLFNHSVLASYLKKKNLCLKI